MQQHEEADTKTVRAFLMYLHKEWQVPERRVRKFVKRHRKHLGFDNVDDDCSTFSDSSFALEGFSGRPKSVLLGSIISATTAEESLSLTTTVEESCSVSPPAAAMDRATILRDLTTTPPRDIVARTNDPKLFSPLVVNMAADAMDEVSPLSSVVNLAAVPADNNNSTMIPPAERSPERLIYTERMIYCDDNDGKKQRGLLLERCDGCCIM
jgi:hypothetical protein